MTPDNIKSEIVAVGKTLVETGLVVASWGNVSARLEKNIIITPSGTDYHKINEGQLIIVDEKGEKLEGKLKPSTELKLHLEIYKNRKDVNAIVHTHSTNATTCAVLREHIPPLVEDVAMLIGGNIEVAQYFLPGTKELAQAAVDSLGNRGAVLLANHGVVGVGSTLKEALYACLLVEKAAQIHLLAKSAGNPHSLPEEDVKKLRKTYLESYVQK